MDKGRAFNTCPFKSCLETQKSHIKGEFLLEGARINLGSEGGRRLPHWLAMWGRGTSPLKKKKIVPLWAVGTLCVAENPTALQSVNEIRLEVIP